MVPEMKDWKYRIRGLRQHLTEDESPAGVKSAADGIVAVLRKFTDNAIVSFRNRTDDEEMHWRLDEDDIQRLEEIIEEMTDAGDEGDCEWFNGALAGLYDFCDANAIWIECDHPETGV